MLSLSNVSVDPAWAAVSFGIACPMSSASVIEAFYHSAYQCIAGCRPNFRPWTVRTFYSPTTRLPMIYFLTTKQPVLLCGLALYREQKSSADDFELKLPDCTFHTVSDPEFPSL